MTKIIPQTGNACAMSQVSPAGHSAFEADAMATVTLAEELEGEES
jgi:hypothetical protein